VTEEEELLIDWKAVYGEQNPKRPVEQMQYTAAMLALGTLLRREIRTGEAARVRYRLTHRLLQYNGDSV
jgi:hypothetical protein